MIICQLYYCIIINYGMLVTDLKFKVAAVNNIIIEHKGNADQNNNNPGPGKFFIHKDPSLRSG
jgi:hypothetical protein